MSIPRYPHRAPLDLTHRPRLHPVLAAADSGISEYNFANLYLFRHKYRYETTALPDGRYALAGREHGVPFWIFPQGLPGAALLREVCRDGHSVKCIAESEAERADGAESVGLAVPPGYAITEDRDNFDYLYRREDLARLAGRKYHKKRNLINNFLQNHRHRLRPLGPAEVPHALHILERWREEHGEDADYDAAREALENMEALGLCGYVAYAEQRPIAFAIGEGIARHRIYVIHFEKGLSEYKGVYQYINMAYAAMLPRHYEYINREQDMGDEGLRQAKMTYRPVGFVRKYRLAPKPAPAPSVSAPEAPAP